MFGFSINKSEGNVFLKWQPMISLKIVRFISLQKMNPLLTLASHNRQPSGEKEKNNLVAINSFMSKSRIYGSKVP